MENLVDRSTISFCLARFTVSSCGSLLWTKHITAMSTISAVLIICGLIKPVRSRDLELLKDLQGLLYQDLLVQQLYQDYKKRG